MQTVIIFNKYYEVPFEEYDIDYDYYIEECYKIIHKIDGTEERLEIERKELREKVKTFKDLMYIEIKETNSKKVIGIKFIKLGLSSSYIKQ